MRRLRRTEALRDARARDRALAAHLVQPLFVVAGEGVREEVPSMPGIERFSISELVAEAARGRRRRAIRAVILFGIPADKDEAGSGAYDDEGVVQLAVRALKEAHPDLRRDHRRLPLRVHVARPLRRSSATARSTTTSPSSCSRRRRSRTPRRAPTWSRPSDMMDGRVGAIRSPARRGGPLRRRRSSPTAPSTRRRSTARSARPPSRRPSSATAAATRWTRPTSREALREAKLDLEEGADMVMVKPALPYLDVIRARQGGDRRPGGRVPRLRRVLDAQGGGRRTAGSTSARRCSRR